MTEQKIGQFLPVLRGGGRFKIPEAEGFYQMSGVQFKVINIPWIQTTDTTDIEELIGQAVKNLVESITYEDEPLLGSVIIGDSKPQGNSTALIEISEPANDPKLSNMRKSIITTATGYVTFIFKEELSDARVRRRKASGYFWDLLLSNPIIKADID